MSSVWRALFVVLVSLVFLGPSTWAGLRLLGVRRGWVANLGSAAAGFVVGWMAALVLAEGDLHDPDLIRDVIVCSLLATMGMAVASDLMARPGSLARGDAAGLVVVNNPVTDARRRLDGLRRTREVLRVAAENGFGPVLGFSARRAKREVIDRDPGAVRVRHALEQCGGMFVKLGQVASTRSDLLPPDVIVELTKLQDDVAVAPPDDMRRVIEAEIGAPIESVFAELDWEPKAAASIGQVYFATLHTGEDVVLKVQRPGVAEVVERDTRILVSLAGRVQRSTPQGARYHVEDLAREFTGDLARELDFRHEAKETVEIGGALLPDDGVVAPEIFEQFTTRRLIVQQRLFGVSVREAGDLGARGIDPRDLADRLLQVALRQMMVEGHFHADLHPGNLFVLEDGTLGMIDFGSTGRLDPLTLASLRQMMMAVVVRDAALLRQSVAEVCTMGEVDDAALERALARFMSIHLAPQASIDGAVLVDLLQMLTTFGIRVPAELQTFARALVVLEGTLQTISPGYRVSERAQDFAGDLVEESTGTTDPDELLQQELIAMLPTLRQLPRHADRLALMAEKGTLSLRITRFADQHDVDVVTRLVNRVVLAVAAASTGIAGALLVGTSAGPDVGQIPLSQLAGGGLLVAASVLGLRVVAAVARDGRN